ncbi:hypothetical protein BDW71DRAFT_201369 [Aspergillus fruticulosus]
MSSDSQIECVNDVVIIGAGFSGLTMACQLQWKLNHFDYVIYERSAEIDPRCAVDIPAACYSLSFAPNAEFTKFFPSQKEVLLYIWKVADKYNIHPHVFCNVECEGCTILHECKILISAVGALVNPKPFSLPGTDLFQGPIIYTARWPQDAVLHGKNIVVTPQYYIPSRNVNIGSAWRNLFLYVPGVLLILRLIIFLYLETASFMFGLDVRSKKLRHHYEDHISLTDNPITAVKKHSILTRLGKEYPADVIDTNICGRNGRSQSDHWKSYGCIEAYHSITMSGFPNFFYILGPNSGRGHTSTIYVIESYTTQVLRIVTPLEIEKTIWATSCTSYFIDSETGKNWFIYPWSSF